MLKTYYLLTKPGIIMGNAITATAGFVLASQGNVNFGLLLATLTGLSLIIASACVFNNYIDRDIDKNMKRTSRRALVTGLVSKTQALAYANILGLLGILVLAFFTNPLALTVALTGFFAYVVLYGFWKRRSVYGTVIGSISGAVPPVVGYTAVSNRLDIGAAILFFILVFWQMPHFFAIAIYRLKDYTAAGLPVLPVKKGVFNTKVNMLFYIIAFIAVALMLFVFEYTGYIYAAMATLLGISWLWLCIKGFRAKDNKAWARGMFRYSLLIITILSITIVVDAVL